MRNPALVDVWRGPRVESRHHGAVAVVDADGATVFALGDTAMPVYPRSAVKPIQALPLVESGAAERYGFGDEELALACASHGGEPAHVDVANRMLTRAGLDVAALECGTHWPSHQASTQALARNGAAPSALHNNCSGKHAGFLCAACALGAAPDAYAAPEHPVQRAVKAILEDLGGAPIPDERRATDGCSVPTFAMPLADLARGFARLGSGQRLGPVRRQAADRLLRACMAEPWFTAGTGRFCTEVMTALAGAAYLKTGAEGVYAAAVPALGLGIAVKAEDGAGRAAEVILAATLTRLLPAQGDTLWRFANPVLRNWNGLEVGALRPAEALTGV
jgi:L-asparaginase II